MTKQAFPSLPITDQRVGVVRTVGCIHGLHHEFVFVFLCWVVFERLQHDGDLDETLRVDDARVGAYAIAFGGSGLHLEAYFFLRGIGQL